MVKCGVCGFENAAGVQACGLCGSPVEVVLAEECAFCGLEIESPCDVPPADTCSKALDILAKLQGPFEIRKGELLIPTLSNTVERNSLEDVRAVIDIAVAAGNPTVTHASFGIPTPSNTVNNSSGVTGDLTTLCDDGFCEHAPEPHVCVRSAAVIEPLEWDVTDWIDGAVVPHYTGWFDVQMRSRIHDDEPAPGITRFWFAGRDWYTGPQAIEHGAPCVPRGSIFAWRGRSKP